MKIVFFGTPEFAVASLDAIIKAGHEVAAVVTMPDKPAGRGHHMFQSPVKVYAVEHDIPVLQPVRLKDENFIKQLQAINAPLFVVYPVTTTSSISNKSSSIVINHSPVLGRLL